VLDDLDLLLIMTVNPGFGGQELLPAMLGKVAAARGLLERCGRDIDLEVDGGVTLSNARELACAGATVFVAGTTVFHHPEGAAAGVRELASAARAGACHE
jgi:ribulose-phosphate 3-epimerase